jgi:glycerol-3-phosphate dehydrogenase (NAD(P)+)
LNRPVQKVGVIGGGAWGTALAQVAARASREVVLWAREPEVVEAVTTARENTPFLPGVELDAAVRATGDPAEFAGLDAWLAVPPAQHLRSTLAAFAPLAAPGLPVVLCAKGIEQGSLKLMTEVLAEALPEARPAVLSGPSFAGEVARGLPTAVTLACRTRSSGACWPRRSPAPLPALPRRRHDRRGGWGRGQERAGHRLRGGGGAGARPQRPRRSGHPRLRRNDPDGRGPGRPRRDPRRPLRLGDLVLTCSSPQSRNMSVGLALGRGQTWPEARAGAKTVAEGVASAPAVHALADKLGVDMPICRAVCALLDGRLDVDAAMAELLSRPLKAER